VVGPPLRTSATPAREHFYMRLRLESILSHNFSPRLAQRRDPRLASPGSRVTRTLVGAALLLVSAAALAAAAASDHASALPVPLSSYRDSAQMGLFETLRARIDAVPFNLVATAIFFFAICHTFVTTKFRHWAHLAEEEHAAKLAERPVTTDNDEDAIPDEVSFKGQILHFLGEVEAVFGIWVLVLIGQ